MNNPIDLGQAVDLTNLLDKSDEEKATQLPKPSGYRILCAIPEVEKEYRRWHFKGRRITVR
jgi:hypothetical protein